VVLTVVGPVVQAYIDCIDAKFVFVYRLCFFLFLNVYYAASGGVKSAAAKAIGATAARPFVGYLPNRNNPPGSRQVPEVSRASRLNGASAMDVDG